MRWFNERTIRASFEEWRYGKSSQRVPMLEIYMAGFNAGVIAEGKSIIGTIQARSFDLAAYDPEDGE